MALSSSARKPIDSTRSRPSPTAELEGDHLLVPGLHLARHPEQPGDREAPDVGVEHPDGQPAAGQGHRQVDGDRALPHPALARGDGQHPGGVGDVGDAARGPGPAAGPGPSPPCAARRPSPRWSPTTRRTPSRAPTWVSTSWLIWVRSGQPATVRATSTSTVPASGNRTAVTMPRSTMSAPSSGSTTARRASRTCSAEGPAPAARSASGGASGGVTLGILPGRPPGRPAGCTAGPDARVRLGQQPGCPSRAPSAGSALEGQEERR